MQKKQFIIDNEKLSQVDNVYEELKNELKKN